MKPVGTYLIGTGTVPKYLVCHDVWKHLLTTWSSITRIRNSQNPSLGSDSIQLQRIWNTGYDADSEETENTSDGKIVSVGIVSVHIAYQPRIDYECVRYISFPRTIGYLSYCTVKCRYLYWR